MTLPQLVFAFCIVGALLTVASWFDVLAMWDTLAVSTAGILVPVWDAMGAPLLF